MTQDMTEMIITERNTYRKTESAHCHTVDKEMSRCTQGATKVYPRCTQALSRLMSMLRSSLGAGKEQLRSSLGAPKEHQRSTKGAPKEHQRSTKGALWSMPTLCRDAHLNNGCRGKWCVGAGRLVGYVLYSQHR